MDKKRKFRIEGGNNGGETVIGTVSVEFVKYWQQRDSGDLIEHLESIYVKEKREMLIHHQCVTVKIFLGNENAIISNIFLDKEYAPSVEDSSVSSIVDRRSI